MKSSVIKFGFGIAFFWNVSPIMLGYACVCERVNVLLNVAYPFEDF